jgi:Fe-S-cluster containining protein
MSGVVCVGLWLMKAFECKQCGECCYGEGGILLQPEETEKIADFLGLTCASFIALHCEERHDRLYIRSASNGYCAFFDRDRQCLIHPVKPGPCSLWPFYPALLKDRSTWDQAKEACPGINPEASFEDFVKASKE